MDIEKLAKKHEAEFTDWQDGREAEIAFYGGASQLERFAEAYHQAKCNEEIQTLRAKVASAENDIKDAERYRWLKNNEQVDVALCVWVDDDLTSECGYYSAIIDYLIDEEIDKAMLNSAPTISETNTEVGE